jgi:HSP20 family molecular chaperone IbpA
MLFRPTESAFRTLPAVDVAETETYEIKAELPGLDEKNIEVKLAKGVLSIKGEKQEEIRAQLSGARGCRYRQSRC